MKRALWESSKLRKNLAAAHLQAQAAAICQLAAEGFSKAAKNAASGSGGSGGAGSLSMASLSYLPASVVVLEDGQAPCEACCLHADCCRAGEGHACECRNARPRCSHPRKSCAGSLQLQRPQLLPELAAA